MADLACFGIPSIFSFKSPVCGGCHRFGECQQQAHDRLLTFPEPKLVANLLEQHELYVRNREVPVNVKVRANRVPLSQAQRDKLESLPKKVQAVLKTIWTKGRDAQMRLRLDQGLNPFDKEGARPYHVAWERLRGGKVDRGTLCAAFMQELGWTYQSAYSQVSMIWHVFPALDLAKNDGAFLKVGDYEYQ